MARGGYRPNAGRPPGSKTVRMMEGPPDEDPMSYMLRIMRDPRCDVARRDRMAIVLAGLEARAGATAGKKARAQAEARRAGEDSEWSGDWGNDLE